MLQLTVEIPTTRPPKPKPPKPRVRMTESVSLPRPAVARMRRLKTVFGPATKLVVAYLEQLENLVLARLSPAEVEAYLAGQLPKAARAKILEKAAKTAT